MFHFNAVRRLAIAGLMLQCFVLSCNGQEDSRLVQSVSKVSLSVSNPQIRILENQKRVVFYDTIGRVVKEMKLENFPLFNPLHHLPFPKDTVAGSIRRYLPLCAFDDKDQLVHRVKIAPKVKIINELKKYGLEIRHPDAASLIDTDIQLTLSSGTGRFLMLRETGLIRNVYERENIDEHGDEQPNTVVDCSNISVYNHLGELVYKSLIVNKLVYSNALSDDGRFLLTEYFYGRTGEGVSELPGGLLLIDNISGDMIPIICPFYKNSRIVMIDYADQYFQIMYEPDKWLFITPYTRTFHQVRLPKEQVKGKSILFPYQSFHPFEGVYIDLKEYPSSSF